MDIVLIIVFVLLGAAIGSFLNVCIDRLPVRKSLLRPPSHCDNCQYQLGVKDLIPVLSFIWLRRRCRSCEALIPWRVFWIEIGTGIFFGFAYWFYIINPASPETVQLIINIFYSCVFIVIFGIDLEHHLILNRIVYPIALIALILDIALYQPWFIESAPGVFLSMSDVTARTVIGITGGVTGFVLLLIPALVFRGGMGWGDVKMAGLIGLVVGFPLAFVSILGAIIGGGILAAILLLLRIKKRGEAIPFGPFLSLAAIATLLFGNNILSWYLGLFP
jgi:leader peptidase (prepilin peptidase)/N-methyltransferase